MVAWAGDTQPISVTSTSGFMSEPWAARRPYVPAAPTTAKPTTTAATLTQDPDAARLGVRSMRSWERSARGSLIAFRALAVLSRLESQRFVF